ncbi:MAG: nuclear transport factor 2 family protein [Actinomycetota bacterium]|nr:nuclear transport factor 2 family protein [Actinomycetota bacterium]
MHPFVALMKKYCIDYTNSHDQSLYGEIMEPDYVVNINGMQLEVSTTYSASVTQLFDMCPGLGLVVHRFVLNGDRLAMYFSEHTAMPGPLGNTLCCWRGIGLYKWNGTRLTENFVEQDYVAMQAQLATGEPHPLIPPHIDPWTTTEAVPEDPGAEAIVREWLERGDLADADDHEIDDARTGTEYVPVIDVESLTVNDLFSAGSSVPFHVRWQGTYRGGLGEALDDKVGRPMELTAVGIAEVVDGRVTSVKAITGRLQAVTELSGVQPAFG